MSKLHSRPKSLVNVYAIPLFLVLVVPEISERAVGALSVGFGTIGESESFEVCRWVLGTVEY